MSLSYRLAGGTSATNPASLPMSAFTVPVRLAYDPTDPTVSAKGNAVMFANRLTQAGKNVSVRVHNSEHSTPPGTPADLISSVKKWIV